MLFGESVLCWLAEIPSIPTQLAHFETLFVLETGAEEVSATLDFIPSTNLRESYNGRSS